LLGLTEPRAVSIKNGLRDLCEAFAIPTLLHDPSIGGRYSALTNVGLLPASPAASTSRLCVRVLMAS
jgi:glucose-6-phosphate isomerase